MNRSFEDKSYYKIELEMELVLALVFLDQILSLLPNIYLLILSYFGSKMGIPLLFFKDKKNDRVK